MTSFKPATCSICGTDLDFQCPADAYDITCFLCDNHKENPSMRDLIDGLRVFRIPLRMTVYADAFVLATDAGDARVQAVKIKDLGSLFDLDDTSISANDECLAEFINYDVPTIETDEPKPVPHDYYDPAEHPDFDEALHCVEEDYNDIEDDAEGGPLRS